jgi:hypothetical protein
MKKMKMNKPKIIKKIIMKNKMKKIMKEKMNNLFNRGIYNKKKIIIITETDKIKNNTKMKKMKIIMQIIINKIMKIMKICK